MTTDLGTVLKRPTINKTNLVEGNQATMEVAADVPIPDWTNLSTFNLLCRPINKEFENSIKPTLAKMAGANKRRR